MRLILNKELDIYALPGTKVVFLGKGGWPGEAETASRLLETNKIYTVYKIDVECFHSDVWLEEVPDRYFNSVLFTQVA